MTKRRQAKSRIPEFQTYEEEAEFWDTHDTTEFEDEFEEVQVRFSKNLSQSLTVRLDEGTIKQMRDIARQKGIGPTTLARMWILERLRGQRRPSGRINHSQ